MNGKELIMYILQNNLYFNDVGFILSHMFKTEEEVASMFNVGVETVRTWTKTGEIDSVVIGGVCLYSRDVMDPRNWKEIK